MSGWAFPVSPDAGPRLTKFLEQLATVHISPLLAWRQTVDTEAHLKASFQDLCRGCAQMRWDGDVAELWMELDGDNSGFISFSEVSPAIGKALEKVREKVRDRGDCALELFSQFDSNSSGSLDEEEFLKGCQRQGYDLPAEDLVILFHALDTDGSGLIHQGEMALLEEDPVERRKLEQQFRDGVNVDIRAMRAKAKARMDFEQPKPWKPFTASQLLALRRSVQARKRKLSQEAVIEFHSHLLKTYGNMVRAWRRGLDPKGKMVLDKKQLLQYLRGIGFKSDGALLFMRLDADRGGSCSLEELDPIAADVIAHFRLWALKKFPGGPVQAFDIFTSPHTLTDETRSFTVSPEKRILHFTTFKAGCKRFGFNFDKKELAKENIDIPDNDDRVPGLKADQWLKFLFDSLDYSGIGRLTRYDFGFVQNWQPPPWFVVPPDVEGLRMLRRMMLDRHGNFVRSWRKALDLHGTNRVSWADFVKNCNAMGFTRNLPGIFAALDPDKRGWISLREIDRASHEYLRSFKNWADNTFGGVVAAFNALDINADCELTLTELRKAAKRYGWGGSVKTLFKLLDTENEHRLTVQAVQFLDDWDLDQVDSGKGYGILPKQDDKDEVPREPGKKSLALNSSSGFRSSGGGRMSSASRCSSAPRLSSGIVRGTVRGTVRTKLGMIEALSDAV